MTALAHEPFALPWAEARVSSQLRLGYARSAAVCSRIERVRIAKHEDALRARGEETVSAHGFQAKLAEYKALARDGWDVTALLAPDSKTVLLMACREEER